MKIVGGLVAGALALGGLAACSAPGTAGSANGVTISENQVDTLASEIKANGGSISNRGVALSLLQLDQVFADLVAKQDYTDQQMNDFLSTCSQSYGFVGTGTNVPDPVKNFCAVQVAAQTDSELLQEASALTSSLSLTVSPRYGEISNGQLSLPAYLQSASSQQ